MTTPETAMCACGHAVIAHTPKPATKKQPRRRGECTHADASGVCPCKVPK